MVEVLPEHPETREAAAEARVLMVELGALPFLERLDAALARAPSSATPPDVTVLPASLAGVEVLGRRRAAGRTERVHGWHVHAVRMGAAAG